MEEGTLGFQECVHSQTTAHLKHTVEGAQQGRAVASGEGGSGLPSCVWVWRVLASMGQRKSSLACAQPAQQEGHFPCLTCPLGSFKEAGGGPCQPWGAWG